jgi:glycine betaine/choline ABC-type transport system substrate-binding protein
MTPRVAAALLLTLLLGCLWAGCGGGSDDPKKPGEVTIVVGSKDTAEELILGEIYAQTLEAAGFRVKREAKLPAGYPPFEQKGLHISGYPEHLNIALKDILKIRGNVPGNAAKAYAIAKQGLAERGLTAFPPTSYGRSKAVGMLRTTAEKRDLKTLTDLKAQAGEMSVVASYLCRVLPDCLAGLERTYRIAFGAYTAIEPPERYEWLEDGEAEASILLNTEARLAGKRTRFVVLEDDKHRLPAGNVFWLTKTEVAEEGGPRYEKAILAAQKDLTLKKVQEMDAEVNLEGRSPAEVAADYLKSTGSGS